MVTNVYPIVAEESSVANAQKVAKMMKNQKNGKRWVSNSVFANELPNFLVLSVTFY
jgi:hypothetical protein